MTNNNYFQLPELSTLENWHVDINIIPPSDDENLISPPITPRMAQSLKIGQSNGIPLSSSASEERIGSFGYNQRMTNMLEDGRSFPDSVLPSDLTFGTTQGITLAVNTNEDISEKIISFARENNGETNILSGIGKLKFAQILQKGQTTTTALEGRYEIVFFKGSYLLPEEGDLYRMEDLDISLMEDLFTKIDGHVHGHLIAASPCQIILGKRIATPDSPQQQSSITSVDSNSEASTSGSRKRKRSRRGGN